MDEFVLSVAGRNKAEKSRGQTTPHRGIHYTCLHILNLADEDELDKWQTAQGGRLCLGA
jgi:hypothetical protein